jgi:hypothetical protein
MREYFQEVGPIASNYGFLSRGHLDVIKARAGSFRPNNFVGFYSFPSIKSSRQFEEDPRWPPIKAKRAEIWSDLRISKYEIGAPTVLRFEHDKVYEVRYEWLKGSGLADQNSMHGGKVVIELTGGQHEMTPADLEPPSRILIIAWPDLPSATSNSPRVSHYRRVDSLYTRAGMD